MATDRPPGYSPTWAFIGRMVIPALLLIGFAPLGCMFGLFYNEHRTEERTKQLQDDFERSVPIGADEATARAWFARQGITPSDTVNFDYNGNQRMSGLHGRKEDDDWADDAELQINVSFNDAGHVKSRSVIRRITPFVGS